VQSIDLLKHQFSQPKQVTTNLKSYTDSLSTTNFKGVEFYARSNQKTPENLLCPITHEIMENPVLCTLDCISPMKKILRLGLL
jgi:hypothetical protein